MTEDYTFKYRGKIQILNGKLIEQQKIDVDACHKIADLHRKKMTYLDIMATYECSDKLILHDLYDQVRNIEFLLQDAWGFPRNENWHRHWEVPHCTCPRMDNMDAYPHRGYISGNCVVHGDIN